MMRSTTTMQILLLLWTTMLVNGTPLLRDSGAFNQGLSPFLNNGQMSPEEIRNMLKPTMDRIIQEARALLQNPQAQAILKQLQAIPEFQALQTCLERVAGLDVNAGNWETISNISAVQPSRQRFARALFNIPDNVDTALSIPEVLSSFLKISGLDGIADRIRKFLDRNIDVKRIASQFVDNPLFFTLLDIITNLPIFTIFGQDLVMADGTETVERSAQLRSRSGVTQEPICDLPFLKF